MEIINFIFRSFWTFIGSLILISAIGSAINQIIKAFIPVKHIHINGYKLDNEQIQKIVKGAHEEEDD